MSTPPPDSDDDIPFARPLSYEGTDATPRRPSAGNVVMNLLGGGLLVFLGGGISIGAAREFAQRIRGPAGDPIEWFQVTIALAGLALLLGGLGMLVTTFCALLGLPSPARWFGRR